MKIFIFIISLLFTPNCYSTNTNNVSTNTNISYRTYVQVSSNGIIKSISPISDKKYINREPNRVITKKGDITYITSIDNKTKQFKEIVIDKDKNILSTSYYSKDNKKDKVTNTVIRKKK